MLFESRGERLVGSWGRSSCQIITEEADGLKSVRIDVDAGLICCVAREGPEGGPRIRPQGGRPPSRRYVPTGGEGEVAIYRKAGEVARLV